VVKPFEKSEFLDRFFRTPTRASSILAQSSVPRLQRRATVAGFDHAGRPCDSRDACDFLAAPATFWKLA